MRLTNLYAGYASANVVRGISTEIRAGEIFVLVGPNGAGKSSLLRVLTGRLPPRCGDIWSKPERARRNIELVPQEMALYPLLTAQENCTAFGMMAGMSRGQAGRLATDALKSVGCAQFCDTRVDRLSGGFKRRVDIAVSLMTSPAILALDEPSAGLDATGRDALIRLLEELRAKGTGSVVVTHDFEFAEAIADRIGILVDGALIVDAPLREALQEAFNSDKLLEVDLDQPPDLRQRRSLLSFGLSQSSSQVWTSRTRSETNTIGRLTALLKSLQLVEREIRIRHPSLRDLYHKHAQGPTGL